jgi:hypothetical protein
VFEAHRRANDILKYWYLNIIFSLAGELKWMVKLANLPLLHSDKFWGSMASKGKGKGKGKAKKFDLEPQKKVITQHEGALDGNFFVDA